MLLTDLKCDEDKKNPVRHEKSGQVQARQHSDSVALTFRFDSVPDPKYMILVGKKIKWQHREAILIP